MDENRAERTPGRQVSSGSTQNSSRMGLRTSGTLTTRSETGTLEQPNHKNSCLHRMSGKEIAATSSNAIPSSSARKQAFHDLLEQRLFPRPAVPSSRYHIDDSDRANGRASIWNLDSDGRQNYKEESVSIPNTANCLGSSFFKGTSSYMTSSSSNSRSTSSSKACMQINERSGSVDHEGCSSSSDQYASASKISTHAAKCFPRSSSTWSPRSAVACQNFVSTFDACHSGYSSTGSNGNMTSIVRNRPDDGENPALRNRQYNKPSAESHLGFTNRPDDGENPALRNRQYNESSAEGHLGSTHSQTSVMNLLIPGRKMHQPNSISSSNQLIIRDDAVSVRTEETIVLDSRIRTSTEVAGTSIPVDESIVISQLRQTQFPIPRAGHVIPPFSLSSYLPHVLYNSRRSQTSSGSYTEASRSVSNPDDRIHFTNGYFSDQRHNLRHINNERVEEQLRFLESDLFSGALSLHDPHRDLRMDIDNMSYEELLALEERIGNAGTFLSEEQLSKCLARSTYKFGSPVRGTAAADEDTACCNICLEEYVGGDDMGTLPCQHRYHVACIHEWLSVKNWCPVCKSSVLHT